MFKKKIFFMPTLIKMASQFQGNDATVGGENKKQVNLGLVILVAVLIVIVIFIVMKCKLKCGPNQRDGYCRFSWGNDTSGTGYGKKTSVDFAGPSDPDIAMQDDPHYKADPTSKYLPCDQAPVDFYKTLRSLTVNYDTDPGSLITPPFHEFGQWFAGARGCGVAEPWVNNDIKSRWDFKDRGEMQTTRSLNNQIQQGHVLPVGMDYDQLLNLRKVDQLDPSQISPNEAVLPGLSKYNKKMDAAINQDLDIAL